MDPSSTPPQLKTMKLSYRNISGISVQDTPADIQVPLSCRIPFLSPTFFLFWTQRPIDCPGFGIDNNGITIPYKGDRASNTCLGHNMPNDKTVACTREPSISNQSRRTTQACACQGCGWSYSVQSELGELEINGVLIPSISGIPGAPLGP